eukprot:scaffold32026_cov51-Attheya_sp.AAC.3
MECISMTLEVSQEDISWLNDVVPANMKSICDRGNAMMVLCLLASRNSSRINSFSEAIYRAACGFDLYSLEVCNTRISQKVTERSDGAAYTVDCLSNSSKVSKTRVQSRPVVSKTQVRLGRTVSV